MLLIGCSGTELNHICRDREDFYKWCNKRDLTIVNNSFIGYVLPDMLVRDLSFKEVEKFQEYASKFYKLTQVKAKLIGITKEV